MGMDKNPETSSSSNGDEKDLRGIVNDELTRVSKGGPWVWKLFFLCATPNILNGFHVSSYVFLGQMPKAHWCVIPELIQSNWTNEQMRTISSTKNGLGDGCRILNWNYTHLSDLNYNEAVSFVQSRLPPETISCFDRPGSFFHYDYDHADSSIVPEWNLVCERSFWRTSVAVAVSLGKFVGATSFGLLSDKAGRKVSFMVGALFYIIGSLLTAFSPWYWLFLAGRVFLGSSSSGLFYGAFSLLTENISTGYRSWMSIAFTMSYPIGMILLAITANFVHQWRQLQLSLTIPAFLLVFYCYYMSESPRWLLSKGREEKAYKILFNKKVDEAFTEKERTRFREAKEKRVEKHEEESPNEKQGFFKELKALYGPAKLRRMAFICHFAWCVTAMSYYVTALNADNLAANRVVYVTATGCVDIVSYILSIMLLRYFGRKMSSCGLFALSGFFLLSLLAVPRSHTYWVVFLAMAGRFGISAVYSIVTLHTAELFPTEIRSSALGTSSTWSHVGSISAPYVVDFLGQISWFIPTTICGILIVVAGLLTLTHPETRARQLKDHV